MTGILDFTFRTRDVWYGGVVRWNRILCSRLFRQEPEPARLDAVLEHGRVPTDADAHGNLDVADRQADPA